jgi:hypothetical protein
VGIVVSVVLRLAVFLGFLKLQTNATMWGAYFCGLP